MFLTRKIGSFLRGKATRGQVFLAGLLAGVLGFVPGFFLPSNLGGGFAQSPGLILLLLFLVLVLNANLGVFGLVTIVAKLVSLVAMPIAHAIGRALVDGPLQPLFKVLVNARVTAWFGLDYYATTGGIVLGLFFGTASGLLFARMLMTFRRRMANVEATSERYQNTSGKWWARFLAWVLFGKGKGNQMTWQQLADDERRGRNVRIGGVVLVVLITAGLWVFQSVYSTPLLTSALRSGLTAANGATTDVGKVELDLAGGALRITGLAIADSSKLDTDLFAAGLLEASIDTGALLQRRLVIDTLRSHDARSGTKRSTPGQLVPKPPEPPVPPDTTSKTLDDYLQDVELWRGRIAQAREWIQWLSGADDEDPKTMTPERRQQRVEQQVERYGLAMACAEHLRDEQPLVLIRKIEIHGIDAARLGQKVDFDVANFSSNAHLLRDPPTFSIKAADGTLAVAVAGPSQATKGASLDLACKGLSLDAMFAQLKTGGHSPVHGGTFDVATKGTLLAHPDRETTIDLPLQVTLHDTTFALAGHKETRIEQLVLPIGVRGEATRPKIALDDKVLADALLQAGQKELATFVQGQAGQLLGKVPGAGDLIDPTKSPQQIADEARKKAEDAAKAAAKKAAEDAAKKAAEEAAKKGLGDTLKGLLPGGKKN
jgi:uncharacterized protein (TIGR03546 family)